MSTWQAIILGIVQGLTEFLPISSSAHLIIVPWLAGWDEPGLTFDVAVHLGTLSAVLLYFWRDILSMAIALPRGIAQGKPMADPMSRLAVIIIVGSIPAAIAGFLIADTVDSYFHSGGGGNTAIIIVALLLMVLGAILAFAERVANHCRPLQSIALRDGLIIGCAQALALLPGVSRSGSTITTGLLLNFKRETAARFSFLLGIPAIFGAGILETRHFIQDGFQDGELTLFLSGMVSAGIVGYLAIAFLLRFLQRRSTMIFIVYRFALGLLLLALVAFGY